LRKEQKRASVATDSLVHYGCSNGIALRLVTNGFLPATAGGSGKGFNMDNIDIKQLADVFYILAVALQQGDAMVSSGALVHVQRQIEKILTPE
jgi:hypothetical protein